MRGMLVVALLLALMWGSGEAFSQDMPSTGTITGRLENGTAGAALPAGLTVELSQRVGTTLRSVATTDAGDDGTFAFTDVPIDGTATYVVRTTYAGVTYESEPIQLENGRADATTELRVYETTERKDDISIQFQHLIVEPDSSSGHLVVSESVTVANNGDRTYVGRAPKHEGMAAGAVRFTLPEGAHGLELISGITREDIAIDSAGFFDQRPLAPGTREIAFGYGLETEGESVIFRRILDYPTQSMVILARDMPPPESTLFSQWERRELPLGDGEFVSYLESQAEGLTPATPVEITFRGLPPPPAPVSDAGSRKLSLFIGGLGLLLALGLIAFALRRWERAAPVPARSRREA